MIARRQFIGGALALGAAALLPACGSDDDGSGGSAGGSGGGGSGGGGGEGPIKVGLLSDLTGPFALYGASQSRAVRLAVQEINAAGGVLDRQLEIIEEDTQTDVSVVVDRARKLVRSDEVDVVFGPIGSDENDAAMRIAAEEAGRLYFYCEGYEGGKCDPLYFSFSNVPSQQTKLFIPHLQEEFGPKALFFGADFAWPHRTFEVAQKTVEDGGGEVVGELYLPIVSDDFTALVNEVRDKQPDYIYALYPAVFGAALKALHDAGLYGQFGIGNTFVGDPDLAGIGDLADGMLSSLAWSKAIDTPAAQKFLTDFQAMHGADAVPTANESVPSYNAAYLYKAAVEKAGTTESSEVAAALVGLSHDGPTGEVTMTESHHTAQPSFLVRAEAGEYTFVQAFDSVEPEEPACT